jgi:8-oxo-dGTP diphosphatase
MLFRNKKQNDYHEGKWNGLGGKLEPHESPEECAVREVFEESGLKVKKLEYKGHITFPMFDGKDDWYVFLYNVFEFSGELISSPEGTLEWIDNCDLMSLNLWEGDKIFMPLLYEPGIITAKFEYEEKKLKKHIITIV